MLSFLLIALASAAELEPNPYLSLQLRHTVGFPANRVGIANNTAVDIAAIFPSHNSVGIRFLFIPDPPNVYGSATPDFAYGPMFTYAFYGSVGQRFDIYPTAGFGFAMGQNPATRENEILPMLHAGIGMRYHAPIGPTSEIQISPEIGVAPFILAPYFGLNVGMLFPLSTEEDLPPADALEPEETP